MTVSGHWREAGGGQGGTCGRHPFPLTGAFDPTSFQVARTSQGAGGDHRRQGGGEDKAERETAHIIDQHRAPGDKAADQAIGLAESDFDNIDLIGDAAATQALLKREAEVVSTIMSLGCVIDHVSTLNEILDMARSACD